MRTKRLQKSFIKDRTQRERQADSQRDRQTDRPTDRKSQRELKSEGVIGRGIIPPGKKEIMNYRLEWTETERMYRT